MKVPKFCKVNGVSKRFAALLSVSAVVVLFASGCGQQASETTSSPKATTEASASHDDHSGWWCKAHGVPEKECSLCSSKAAERFKAAGDWCEEHNCAKSQCFVCDPSQAEKYADLYEAKYGKEPPKRNAN